MSSSSSSSSSGSGGGGEIKDIATSFGGALTEGCVEVPKFAVPTGCHEGTPDHAIQLPLLANADGLGGTDILHRAYAQIPLDPMLLCCVDQCPSCGQELPCEGG